MRIEKLTLDKEITQTAGIEPINLERLGSVVSLVGRNGSGKSRILRLIESQYLPQINYLRLADGSITYLPEILLKELEQIFPALARASSAEQSEFEVSPSGYGIHWPLIDEDISIDGLLGISHHREPKQRIA